MGTLQKFWDDRRGWLRDVLLIVALIFSQPKPSLLVVGLVLFCIGCGLHFWSKGTLTRNWAVTTAGPYSIVRHPFYFANLLIDLGIGFISGNLFVIGAYIPAYLLTYIPTIRKEERFLRETHKEAYAAYARRVPCLIPRRVPRIGRPLEFSWDNLDREHEIPRLMRILAIPMYFVMVHLVFHTSPRHAFWVPTLVLSIAVAVALNVGSFLVRRNSGRVIWSELP